MPDWISLALSILAALVAIAAAIAATRARRAAEAWRARAVYAERVLGILEDFDEGGDDG